ncbi:MAG TPA: 1-deoxy-D-xylulose-5-phosphate synthase, partial [Brevibacterium senegalense]|nr:1-deoxy-D-xylulose-5-phosphate synthase [Brevibacterium senegalense]
IAKAHRVRGEHDRWVVAVIGDGALTGGVAWEALNAIAADTTHPHRRLVIVINDNGRSYEPTVGGLSAHLDSLRASNSYERLLSWGKERLQQSGPPGRAAYTAMRGVKRGLRDMTSEGGTGMFDALGLKYIGPVDGHDQEAVERALALAKDYENGPVIVHTVTKKGYGYGPAVADEADQFHAVGIIDPVTGQPAPRNGRSWTSVFGDAITEIGQRRDDVVAITAAMLQPVGLTRFREQFPDRTYDVGIAEQHAVASAAGLSYGGLHPVVCLYATFMNRAFDQLLMDVALHRQGVTFVLDRAGVTGPDGASHHGIWDLALLQIVPGLRLAAPRDAQRLVEELEEAVAVDDAPTVVRFSRGDVGDEIVSLRRTDDGADVLADVPDGLEQDVLLVSVGALADRALAVRDMLAQEGIGATVVDPRWVLPVPESVQAMAQEHRLAAVIEDGLRTGGVGSRLRQELRADGSTVGVVELGVPDEFLPQGSRDEILEVAGLTATSMTQQILERLSS